MAVFKEYSRVRVRQLLRSDNDDYDDWRMNERRPRPGDIGTVVEVLRAPGIADRYVVECCVDDGTTEWLSDLVVDELEPVDA